MGYPVGPLLQALAERILRNLDLIDRMAPPWGSPQQNDPPYSDTQLLVSLLGVLVFPHEQSSQALGELLKRWPHLGNVLTVQWSRSTTGSLEIADEHGEQVMIDPSSVDQLPRLLRNSIAHFNIRPINVDGRFGGVRVWNRDKDGFITFVADLQFDALRRMARFILLEMAQGGTFVQLDDPPDPLEEVSQYVTVDATVPKAPRVIEHLWRQFLDAANGDPNAAKTTIDRTLKAELDRMKRKAY